jgi:carbamoyltransferase
MIIVGINGWIERSHDASACIIVDGKLIAYVEEERFTRQKHAFDCLPKNSIAYCLQAANVSPNDVDLIAWGWNLPLLHELHGRSFDFSESDLNAILFPKKYYPNKTKHIPIEFVDHHFAHAASAYCSRSNDETMAVVVLDGAGEDSAVSIYKGEQGKLKKMLACNVPFSPGFFYAAACEYIGLSRHHAGKLMGLASHGNNPVFFTGDASLISSHLSQMKLEQNYILDWEEAMIRYWVDVFVKKWGDKINAPYSFNKMNGSFESNPTFGAREKDIAVSIQLEFEKMYMWYVHTALTLTGAKQVCLAGGATLNCSANGMLMERKIAEQVFVHPAANDSGVALGAAVSMLDVIPVNFFTSPYLGPGFTNDEVRECLIKSGINFTESSDVNFEVSKHLVQGKIVGYFQGRMEVGPRALGGRSILADPRKIDNHTIVNKIKSRELWRPLAPAILAEENDDYFILPTHSPYMLFRNFVKAEKTSLIPAVVHIDNSVRPQTVTSALNKNFYDVLSNFQMLTGVPIVLNTSFNNEREPIVCTPAHALSTFFETGMDVLAIESFVIKKRSQ